MNELDNRATLAILSEAQRLLREKGWTQGALARNAEGNEVIFSSPDACSFCIVGAVTLAMTLATNPDGGEVAIKSMVAAKDVLINLVHKKQIDDGVAPQLARGVPFWNDYVIGSAEEAIALIEEAKESLLCAT